MAVISNKKNGKVVLHFTANATVTVAGNNSVSGIVSNTSEEVVTGGTITKVAWGVTGTDSWTVKRGSNTVLVLTGTNVLNLAEFGSAVNLHPDATLVVEKSGGTGHILIEMAKVHSTYANTGY